MKRHVIVLLLFSLVVLTACALQIQAPAPAAGGPPPFGAAWEAVPCATLAIADVVAAVADCGYITVPETRGESGLALGDKTIQLGVVRLRSTSPTPGSPMIVGTGGPGGDEFLFINAQIGPSVNVPSLYAPVLADRDLVYFTQRGTNGAKPRLYCEAFDAVGLNAAVEGWSQQEREAQYKATLQGCFDALTAQGIDFAAYNTNENAADINDLRQALGYDKIIYYGQSYGTLLGQFLMRNYPDILEAVILDGTLPAEYTTYAQAFDIPGAFQRVFAACAADAACQANYPDPEATLAEVVAAYQANPQPVAIVAADGSTQTLLIDGLTIMGGLFGKMYNGSADLPATIYQLKAHDPATLAQFVPQGGGAVAKLMQSAVNCADDPSLEIDEFDFAGVAPHYALLVTDDAMQHMIGCNTLQVPHLAAASDERVLSELPVLLLNGGLDPATAPDNARAVAAGLPNSQYILFPSRGHVQAQFPCAIALMAAFAANPMAPVDTSCIPPQPTFATPFAATVTSDDGTATITMTLPAGFAPVNSGQWLSAQTLIMLRVFPAGATVEDALKAAVATTAEAFDAVEVVDGAPVAGQPTQVVRGQTPLGGAPFAYDFIAFANDTGAFVIQAYQGNPALLESYRAEGLPALLATVTVSGGE